MIEAPNPFRLSAVSYAMTGSAVVLSGLAIAHFHNHTVVSVTPRSPVLSTQALPPRPLTAVEKIIGANSPTDRTLVVAGHGQYIVRGYWIGTKEQGASARLLRSGGYQLCIGDLDYCYPVEPSSVS